MPSLKAFLLQVGILGKIWQNKFNRKLLISNFILIILQLTFLIIRFNSLPNQIPLYYSLPWGESQLASAVSLFLLPSFSIIFLLLNNLLATVFINSMKVIPYLLITSSFIFSLFSSITLFKIITLVS